MLNKKLLFFGLGSFAIILVFLLMLNVLGITGFATFSPVTTTSISSPATGASFKAGEIFTVVSIIGCQGSKCNTVKSTITFPSGLALKSASASQTWSSILAGSSKSASWLVHANQTGTYAVTVSTTSKNAKASSSVIQVIVYVPVCNANSDCGVSGYISGNYCGADSNVYKDYNIKTCSNAGTQSAFCSSTVTPQLQASCGASGFTGAPFCTSSSVYQNYVTVGCSNGACTSSTAPSLIQICPYDCANGMCSAVPPPPPPTNVTPPPVSPPPPGSTSFETFQATNCAASGGPSESDGGIDIYTAGNSPVGDTDSCFYPANFQEIASQNGSYTAYRYVATCPLDRLDIDGNFTTTECRASSGLSTTSCSGQGCYVSEYFCSMYAPGSQMVVNYPCKYGCSNGACLPSGTISSSCDDTDNGNNPGLAGTVPGAPGLAEQCKSGPIRKVTQNNPGVYMQSILMPNGCLSSEFDTNGILAVGECFNSNPIAVNACSGANCTLSETTCGDGRMYRIPVSCPYGCDTGRCKTQNEPQTQMCTGTTLTVTPSSAPANTFVPYPFTINAPNCDGKLAWVYYTSCTNWSFMACTINNGSCTPNAIQMGTGAPGVKTYVSCIDLNSDGVFDLQSPPSTLTVT